MTHAVARRIAAAALVLAATTAAPAAAAPIEVESAPGRVLYALDGGRVANNVDASGGGFAIALPDGATLVVSGAGFAPTTLSITRVGADGRPDATFGTAGVATVTVPVFVQQALRQPDGKLLLVGTTGPGGLSGPPAMKVARLNADGTLDTAFGAGGTATTAVGIGCGACTTAALAPDGSIVVTGATGAYPTNPTPTTVPDVRWAITRLTPGGATDTTFGNGGVATIANLKASGFNVAVLPDGRIVTEGQTAGTESQIMLARLTSSGAMDPSFGGGAAVAAPFASGFAWLVRGDGSVVVAGQKTGQPVPPFTSGHELVAAFTPAGLPDAAFGAGGAVDLGKAIDVQQILPRAGGGMTVVAAVVGGLDLNVRAEPATLHIGRWGPAGPAAGSPLPIRITFPFGGGGSSFLVSKRPRPLPPLTQNTFSGRILTPRPDGSFLVVGGVHVSQPTGEGTGYSIGRTAIAKLTADFGLDRSFGGPQAPLRAALSVPRQRAPTARDRHGIRVRLRSSSPGLWRVKIRTRDGRRVLAQSVLPVFGTTARTLPVELTKTGNAWLRRHRNVRVSVAVTARDLFGTSTTTTARGTVR